MKRTWILALASLWVWGCGDDDSPRDGFLFSDGNGVADQQPATCSPQNCSGCCRGTACLAGSTVAACGFSGGQCQVCSDGQQCLGGQCHLATCDSLTCADGCCDSVGICQGGTSDTACGGGGTPCAVCQDGAECVARSCMLGGNRRFLIVLASAALSEDCDTVGQCDAYVILTVGGVTEESSIADGTTMPVWNDELMEASEQDIVNGFEVEVRDDDGMLGSELLGTCSLQVTAADLKAGKVVSDCGEKVQNLTFKFKPA